MHRDPDIYRFRIAPLPTKLNHPPHSISIPLDKMIPGEPVKSKALMHAWMTIAQLYVLLRIPSTQVHSKTSCRLC